LFSHDRIAVFAGKMPALQGLAQACRMPAMAYGLVPMELDLDSQGHLLDKLFPTHMVLKVIAVDLGGIDTMIVAALSELELQATCKPGNLSRKGKYITWEVGVFLESREHMHDVVRALAAVEGVKYVL
jgi:putative lipoic acid-binding regulatory protein